MKQILTVKGLVDFAYNKYKSKKAITLDRGYRKSINYFNYRFDIYSLARAINSKINSKKVAIISESRYEFCVTYLANVMLENTVIIIDNGLSQNAISKIIKKYDINTVFFSNTNKDKILEIFKNNTKKKKLNLVNFDSNNKFPIIEYEKLINLGRYIEDNSVDNIPDIEGKDKNIIIVNLKGIKEYSQQDFIISAYIIGKNIKLKKKKEILSDININTFYKTVTKIILPLLYGLNIQFITDDNQKSENNIEILEEEKNKATIHYRKNKYIVQNHNVDTYLLRVEDNLLKKENKKESPNFVLIRSNKREKIKMIEKV